MWGAGAQGAGGRGTGWAGLRSLWCCCHPAMGTEVGTLCALVGWKRIMNPGLGEGIQSTASFFRSGSHSPGNGRGRSWLPALCSPALEPRLLWNKAHGSGARRTDGPALPPGSSPGGGWEDRAQSWGFLSEPSGPGPNLPLEPDGAREGPVQIPAALTARESRSYPTDRFTARLVPRVSRWTWRLTGQFCIWKR